MNTANKITVLRILLVPIFMALFMLEMRTAALILFIIASATDGVDGYIARHYNQITTFGKFIDPLADKMLTTSAFLVLLHYDRISPWAVMIILAREFIVSGIRLVAVSEGTVIAASFWGKLKTVSQMAAIIVSIFLMGSYITPEASLLITNILVWISVALTLISGADYLWKNRGLLVMK